MITKYKLFNESIKSLLVGPSKEEMWKNLGYDRTFDTPKEFFLYMIDGMTIKEQNKYPNSIFWEKNGELIFEQDLDNMNLWVDNKSIWKILEKVFGLRRDEVQSLINTVMEEYFNWKGFIPHKCIGFLI